jgi:FixJ family two-component response regulator
MSVIKRHSSNASELDLASDVTPPFSSTGRAVVHIIDDDTDFLAALDLQLQSFGLTVISYFSAEQFLVMYQPQEVECIVLDLRMPGMTGLELQTILGQRHCCPPVVILSAYSETPDIVRAIQNGAIDYLVKPVDEQILIRQVTEALNQDRDNKRRQGNVSQRLSRLSEREREVMDLFMQATTTIALAHILKISPKTVEKHRARIFEKMEVNSIPALIRLVLDLHDSV